MIIWVKIIVKNAAKITGWRPWRVVPDTFLSPSQDYSWLRPRYLFIFSRQIMRVFISVRYKSMKWIYLFEYRFYINNVLSRTKPLWDTFLSPQAPPRGIHFLCIGKNLITFRSMRTISRNCFDIQGTTSHHYYSATKPPADFPLCRNSNLFQRNNNIFQIMHYQGILT